MRWAAATGDSRSAPLRPVSGSSPEKKAHRRACCTSSQDRVRSSRDALGRPTDLASIIFRHLPGPGRSPDPLWRSG